MVLRLQNRWPPRVLVAGIDFPTLRANSKRAKVFDRAGEFEDFSHEPKTLVGAISHAGCDRFAGEGACCVPHAASRDHPELS